MATLDGRELDLTVPGAVLFLAAEAQRDWVEILDDGVTVQVVGGRTPAVVNGLDAAWTIDDVARDARGLVNQALDLMAVRSLGTYSLTDATAPTVTWAGHGVTLFEDDRRPTRDLRGFLGRSSQSRAECVAPQHALLPVVADDDGSL